MGPTPVGIPDHGLGDVGPARAMGIGELLSGSSEKYLSTDINERERGDTFTAPSHTVEQETEGLDQDALTDRPPPPARGSPTFDPPEAVALVEDPARQLDVFQPSFDFFVTDTGDGNGLHSAGTFIYTPKSIHVSGRLLSMLSNPAEHLKAARVSFKVEVTPKPGKSASSSKSKPRPSSESKPQSSSKLGPRSSSKLEPAPRKSESSLSSTAKPPPFSTLKRSSVLRSQRLSPIPESNRPPAGKEPSAAMSTVLDLEAVNTHQGKEQSTCDDKTDAYEDVITIARSALLRLGANYDKDEGGTVTRKSNLPLKVRVG